MAPSKSNSARRGLKAGKGKARPSRDKALPSSAPRGGAPLELTLSREQAGVMCAFGAGLLFCAFLLGVTSFQKFLPLFWKMALWGTVLFLAWAGASWIYSALHDLKRPIFTLWPDRLVCHDAGGDWEAPLDEIASARFETSRGVKSLILEVAGRRVFIPETLRRSDEAFARLGPRAASDGQQENV
jgi:hypothetical protein